MTARLFASSETRNNLIVSTKFGDSRSFATILKSFSTAGIDKNNDSRPPPLLFRYLLQLNYKFDLDALRLAGGSQEIKKLRIKVRTKKAIASSINVQTNNDSPFQPLSQESQNFFAKFNKVSPTSRGDETFYPDPVLKRIYSAANSASDLDSDKNDNYFFNKEFQIASILKAVEPATSSQSNATFSRKFRYVDLRTINASDAAQQKPVDRVEPQKSLDSTRLVDFINKQKYSFSEYTGDTNVSYSAEKILSDYLFNKTSKKPQQSSIYVPVEVENLLRESAIPFEVEVPFSYKDETLEVICELYRENTATVVQRLVSEINMRDLVDVHEALTMPAVRDIISFQRLDTSGHEYLVTVKKSNNSNNDIVGYSIYRRQVLRDGTLTTFKFLQKLDLATQDSIRVIVSGPLEILRFIPYYYNKEESNIFRDVVLGEGYDEFEKSFITLFQRKYDVVVDVHNIPKNAKGLEFYRRNCDDPENITTTRIDQIVLDASRDINEFRYVDGNAVAYGKKYEYFVRVNTLDDYSQQNNFILTNFVPFICPEVSDRSVKVSLETPNVDSLSDQGDPTISFVLSTSSNINQSDLSSTVIQEIKNKLVEIYSKYVDPANNTTVAELNSLTKDINFKYSDLFLHEIVRTNLNTGEREIFDLVGDGTFEDNNKNRSKSGIKPLNYLNDYIYHVTTYQRSPEELFKNFIIKGLRTTPDSNKRNWFYYPYLWHHPTFRNKGMLFRTDAQGDAIIDDYENIRSISLGLTQTYKLKSVKDRVQLSRIFAERFTFDTIKITWESTSSTYGNSSLNIYDSFVLLKVVNQKASYLGVTNSNFFYDKLKYGNSQVELNDYGTVYYVVIPILEQLLIDDQQYSNEVVVNPVGLHPIRISSDAAEYMTTQIDEFRNANFKENRDNDFNSINTSYKEELNNLENEFRTQNVEKNSTLDNTFGRNNSSRLSSNAQLANVDSKNLLNSNFNLNNKNKI